MIVVSGARRSGTSMWMQVLAAAGLPTIGDEFPLDWADTLAPLNPHGFFESTLRDGINFRTNPDPRSGVYLHPLDTRMHAVKVFAEGLVHSDLAFLDRVLVTIRPWREYVASMDRLHEIEREARGHRPEDRPPRLPGALEWWSANFSLLRDVAMRRYAIHIQSWPAALEQPGLVIPRVLEWISSAVGEHLELDVEAAVAAVRPSTRSISSSVALEEPALDPAVTASFDELFDTIHAGRPLSAALLERMNELHLELEPVVRDHAEALEAWLREHPEAAGARAPLPLEPSAD